MKSKKQIITILSLLAFILLAGSIHAAAVAEKKNNAVIAQINGNTLIVTWKKKAYTLHIGSAKLYNAQGNSASSGQISVGDQIDISGVAPGDGTITVSKLTDLSLTAKDLTRNSVGINDLTTDVANGLSVISGGNITNVANATLSGQLTANGSGNNYFAGNVGIGTTTPDEALDLNGRLDLAQTTAPSVTTDKLYNVGGNLFWNGTQLGSGGSGGGQWTTSGNDIFNANSGNVGIGTTNPGYPLTVAGDAYFGGMISMEGSYGNNTPTSIISLKPTLTMPDSWDSLLSANLYYAPTADSTTGGPAAIDAELYFQGTHSTGSILNSIYVYNEQDSTGSINNLSGINIDSPAKGNGAGEVLNNYGLQIADQTIGTNNYAIKTGLGKVSFGDNVGIGTTTPDEALDLNGRLDLAQTTAPSVTTDKLYNVGGNLFWNGTQLGSGGSGGGQWTTSGNDIFNANSGNVGIGTTTPSQLFQVNASGSNPVVITSGGNVGIGTTSPKAMLDVNGLAHIGPAESELPSYIQNYTGAAEFGITNNTNPIALSIESATSQDYGWGVYSTALGQGTHSSSSQIIGAEFDAYLDGGSSFGNLYALEGYADVSGNSHADNAAAVMGYVQIYHGGTIDRASAVLAATNLSDGTIQTNIGVDIQDQSGVGVDNYNLYSAGSNSKNYFAGNVGIGTTSPAVSLDINGQMKLKINSSQPYACDASHNSAIALTNKYTACVCKNGTGWVMISDGTTACTWN
jgi:hypothetical protein